MKFTICSEEEIEQYKILHNLQLGWDILSEYPQKIEIDGEVVAIIDCSIGGIFGKDSLEIDSFEVFEKGKGIGREIISALLNEELQLITLLPANDLCKKFWLDLGFTVELEMGGVERLVYRK